MKNIATILFVTLFTLVFTSKTHAQISFGIGGQAALPMSNLEMYHSGFGGSLTGHYVIDDKTLIGLQAGYLYFIPKAEFVDFLTDIIPVQVDGRYYITGGHEDGGIFGFAQVGIHYTRFILLTPFENFTSSSTDFSIAPGIGYKLANGLEFSTKLQLIIANQTSSYLPLRVAYNF